MFTKLYLDTTNPTTHFYKLFQLNIFFPMVVSILFHTLIYTSFCNMVSYIFLNNVLSYQVNKKLVFFLLLIMFFGFIARFYHVKEIYATYNGNMMKTRNHLDKLYISWIFIS